MGEHITSMMKLNKIAESAGAQAAAGTAVATTTTAGGSGAGDSETVFTYDYSSIIPRFGRFNSVQLPRQSTLCPADTATPTPALTTSPRSARNPHSREPRSLVSSSLGPTWLRLRTLQLHVAMP